MEHRKRFDGHAAVDPAERNSETASLAHILPFIAWVACLLLPASAAWPYAVRTAAGSAFFLVLRPWRWYPPLRARNLAGAALAGVAVCALWIAPESAAVGHRWPAVQAGYVRWCASLGRHGAAAGAAAAAPYDPAVCGWPMAIVRLLGSALVIAPIEEFFWRGFLYRALLKRRFLEADLGRFAPWPFLLVAALFGVEHTRWCAGLLAGLVYGWLLIRTRDIWAVALAHAVTNLLLGLYVLQAGAYGFW